MQRITASGRNESSHSDDPCLTERTLRNYNPDGHHCQRCGKKIWAAKKTATYRRCITGVKDGQRFDSQIMIPVYLCPCCGKSDRKGAAPNGDYHHAILPDDLIPFTYFTLFFILSVLRDYALRSGSVRTVCEKWDISVSTLYRWKHRYMEQYDAWASSLESIHHLNDVSSDSDKKRAFGQAISRSLDIISPVLLSFPRRFFSRFGFSFLQPNRLSHFRPLPRPRHPAFL